MILPQTYLIEATDWRWHPVAFRPGNATPYLGYGYQFWKFPGEKRRFALLGISGQVIHVEPDSRLVIIQTAVSKEASSAEMIHEFESFVQEVRSACENRHD